MNFRIIFIILIALVSLIPKNIYAESKIPSFEEQHADEAFLFLLYDVSIKVNEDWSTVTRVHKIAKVLKEEAQSLGELPIGYEQGRETISRLKVLTIAPDGKKYPATEIQDKTTSEDYPLYSNDRIKIITHPKVTVGSILEHEFTLTSKPYVIKDSFWYVDTIEVAVPTQEYRLTVTFPKRFDIQYKEFNLTHKPEIKEKNGNVIYSWHLLDAYPTQVGEEYAPFPTVDSFKEGIEFSSIKNWADISNWYYDTVKKNTKLTPELKKLAEEITKDKTSLKDKTRAILGYVQDNFRYVSMSFGKNTLEPHSTELVFKNKYGDCKDLSLFTRAMLEVVGVKANITLFRREDEINDPQYDLPIPTLFDHALLRVEDPAEGDFFIDPLLDGYDIGEYPSGYQGAYAFVITSSGGRFDKFPIFDENKNTSIVKSIRTMDGDGSVIDERDILWNLEESVDLRQKIKGMNSKERNDFEELIDGLIGANGQVLERKLEGLENKYGVLTAHSKVKRNDAYPVVDGMIVIDVDSYDRTGIEFVKKVRNAPVFYPENSYEEQTIIYRIPNGFNFSHIPKNLELNNGIFSLDRTYAQKGQELTVRDIVRKYRAKIPVEDYEKVKQFYDRLKTQTGQRIIAKMIDYKYVGNYEERVPIINDMVRQEKINFRKHFSPILPREKEVVTLIGEGQYEDALKLIDELRSQKQWSEKDAEAATKLCVEAYAAGLYAEGADFAKNQEYGEAIKLLEALRNLILGYPEYFGLDEEELSPIIEKWVSAMGENSTMTVTDMRQLENKLLAEAREVFQDDSQFGTIKMLSTTIFGVALFESLKDSQVSP